MTEKEIIQRSVKKAIDSGMPTSAIDKGTFFRVYTMIRGRGSDQAHPIEFVPEDCYGLIFNHEFAKAFWGEDEFEGIVTWHRTNEQGHTLSMPAKALSEFGEKPRHFKWQYCLQQLVLQENPIQYLKQFIS